MFETYFLLTNIQNIKKLKIIKDSEKYYNLDKLLQLIEPDTDKIKITIIKNYTYANDKYNEHLLNQDMDEMEKYFGAKEMTRKIGIELINYDPEKNLEEVKQIEKEKMFETYFLLANIQNLKV